jgi:hypothetical protein
MKKATLRWLFLLRGGEGGIRTHGTLARTPDFESGTFDHSATSPDSVVSHRCERPHYTDSLANLASNAVQLILMTATCCPG